MQLKPSGPVPSMDLSYSSLLLAIVLVVVVLLVKLKPPARKYSKLPPGPRQLPVIGSLHHMLGSLPHRSFSALAKTHGPVMHLNLGETSNIVISSPEAAAEIFRTQDSNFATRPMTAAGETMFYGVEGMVFAPYGELWRQLRKICVVELLTAKRVLSFRATREEEARTLVRSIAASESPIINLSERMFSLANDITARTIVGGKCKAQAAFLAALTARLEAAGGFDMADLFPSSRLVRLAGRRRKREQEGVSRETDDIMDGIIQERKRWRAAAAASGGDEDEDLLDVLLRVQEEEGNMDFTLTNTNIKSVINDLFGAGSDSASATLVWAMTELMRNPRVMEKAQSEVRGVLDANGKLAEEDVVELRYLNLIVKETLRLHTALPLLSRECQVSCEVLGYDIPAKSRVVVNAWHMGRDPRYWGGDAEEFRPERFDKSIIDYKGANLEFIPFGAGRRMCPGMNFGIANVNLVLVHLLCYFDWLLPENVEACDLDMEETFGVTSAKRVDLCLRAIPFVRLPEA